MKIKDLKIGDIISIDNKPVAITFAMMMSHQKYDDNPSVQPYAITPEFLVANGITRLDDTTSEWVDPDEYYYNFNEDTGTYQIYMKDYGTSFEVEVIGKEISSTGVIKHVHVLQHLISDCSIDLTLTV